MARFIFIVASAILFSNFVTANECDDDTDESPKSNTASPPKCRDNEILDECPVDCPSDYCPKSRHDSQAKCPKPKKCPPAACKCGFNLRRANGTCIPTRDCPPLKCKGPNEIYNPCPPYCPGENCSQATPDGKCHLPGHLPVLECKPACRCKKNYWRLDGICVPYARCPKNTNTTITITKKPKTRPTKTTKPPTTSRKTKKPFTTSPPPSKCGDNEEEDDCPSDCWANYCPKNRYTDQSPCPKPKRCPPPGCKCRLNFRRASNGTCISTRDCPPFACHREHEEFDSCPPFCPGDDCSEATPDGKCHLKGRALIPVMCKPACRCKKNYWRFNGNCVPYNQCPNINNSNTTEINTLKPTTDNDGDNDTTPNPHYVTTTKPLKCKDNEVIDDCPVDCPSDYCPKNRRDSNLQCPKPNKCPPAACKCGFNSRRADNGTCISTRQCPPFKCDGPNEEYVACPPYCPGENCSQATADGECHAIGKILIVVECQPACRCKKNFWRLNGNCVPYEQCPKTNNTIVTTEKPTEQTDREDTEETESTENQTTTPAPSLICGENEIEDKCPAKCPSDYCPKSRINGNTPCTKPNKCPPPACKCRFNYRRAKNGTCIRTTDCPPFKCNGPHEEYNACPPYCPGEKCSQATPDGECHAIGKILITLQCQPACRCKKNYWRLNGVCVPYEKCPNRNGTALSTTVKPETEATTLITPKVKPVPKCGPFETLDDCPVDCPMNFCPKSEDVDFTPCPRPEKCPPPECRCGLDTHRAENGSCVPIQECPPFECSRPNEEYRACYPETPGEDCSEAVLQGDQDTSNSLTKLICKPACRCKKGFWRLNGACVPYEQCKISQCGVNENNVTCKSSCSDSYCPKSEQDSQPRLCTQVCRGPGCVCRLNYRRAANGTCIPTRDCPPFDCTARPNEVYDACPPYCPTDSCRDASPSGKCRIYGRIGILLICNPKCRCKKGYWRNDNGICVPYEKCPNICPINEEYVNCTQYLCRTQNCSQRFDDYACKGDLSKCTGGCVCKDGYLRAKNGTCVEKDKCDVSFNPCGANARTILCASSCTEKYCPEEEADTKPKFCTAQCRGPGCACEFNYSRAKNGTCIPTRMCPSINCSARPNEVFDSCPPYCPSDSCRDATPTGKCPELGIIGIELECNPQCRCAKGYWRNDDGICIPYEQCPNICPINEEYVNCTQYLCRTQNCSQRFDDYACKGDISKCTGGCVCKEGYLRTKKGTCVEKDKCDVNFNPCGTNEHLNSCANSCTERYCPINEADTNPKYCTADCRGPACNCDFNYSRAKNGTCIPTKDCPPFNCSARPNEMYDSCPPDCPSDSCYDATPSGKCPLLGRINTTLECNPKCRCIKGYWRNNKGICVPYAKCPEICPKNEIYTDCAQRLCRPLNCTDVSDYGEIFGCEPDKVMGCQKGCVCKEGFLRANNGTCISDTQCHAETNECSDPNEEYTDCKQTCPGDTCAALTSRFPCEKESCEPGCVCKSGYRRQTASGPCIPICNCTEMSTAPLCQKQTG